MKVFVTGGMGFIGSHLVVEFLAKGHEVTVLARRPEKIPAFAQMPRLTIAKGGLEDNEALAKHLPGHDALVHNALFWGNSPTEMLRNDTTCSIRLFDIAGRSGVTQVVYTSSTAAIGDFQPKMNEQTILKPADFYGATKAATEAYLLAFGKNTSMRCNIVRPGYTVGDPVVPGAPMENDSRFKDIVGNAKAGRDIRVTRHDGTQFIAAADLARIFSSILSADVDREIYFGLGRPFTTWQTIAEEAVRIAQSPSRVVVNDGGSGPEPYLFDLSKIRNAFGLEFDASPTISQHLRTLTGAPA